MRVRGAEQRRRAARLGALTAAVAPLAVCTALAATPSGPVVVADSVDDVTGSLDIQRASLHRAADGRLRAVLTFAAKVTPKSLIATTGPPGSMCVRIWTGPETDPAATRPDRLVCVTADGDAKLRASVLEQRNAGLPRRTATASVTASASGRSFVIRFAQSSLGRPKLIRFGLESTSPGCERTSCIDTAPDAGAVKRFTVR